MISFLITALGLFATYLVIFAVRGLANSTARNEQKRGRLYFGTFMLVFGLVGSAVVAGLVFWLFFTNYKGDATPLLIMIAVFGFFAVSCFAEMIWTNGSFDDEGIRFQSIWKGSRVYKWSQLDKIEANPEMDWHVFTFEDGKKILVSKFMKGHRELLTQARSMGHLF